MHLETCTAEQFQFTDQSSGCNCETTNNETMSRILNAVRLLSCYVSAFYVTRSQFSTLLFAISVWTCQPIKDRNIFIFSAVK